MGAEEETGKRGQHLAWGQELGPQDSKAIYRDTKEGQER